MQLKVCPTTNDQRQWQDERRYVRVKCGRWAFRWPREWNALDVSLAFHNVNPDRRIFWNVSERLLEIL